MPAFVQFIRYVVVGAASNAVLFLIYLGVTYLGLDHKIAMSLSYTLGVIQTFVFNKRWSFESRGATGPSFARYFTAYGIAYLLNLAALIVFADMARLPHQLVQGAAFVILSVMLFIVQRVWVFRKTGSEL